ncbi:MAG: ABC-2 family transporter protein [Deltaproteobacteria bacterium]|nr:ABC-2 family transporter protein [Deltaproteobacteria bacterium]
MMLMLWPRDAIAVLTHLASASLRVDMSHRASFFMASLGNGLVTLGEFLALSTLVHRFEGIAGWSLREVALLYGLVSVSFGLAELFFSGFKDLGTAIRTGDLDRWLLRPRGLVLQVVGQHVEPRVIGRFLQAAGVLGWALVGLPTALGVSGGVLLLVSMVSTVVFFGSVFVLQGATAFWTVESVEALNTLTYGGVDTASLPLSIYPSWLRWFFLIVVPLGCVTFLPVITILGMPWPFDLPSWLGWVAPCMALPFAWFSSRILRAGLWRYASTGT